MAKTEEKKGTDVSSYLEDGLSRIKEVSESLKEKGIQGIRNSGKPLSIPVNRLRLNPLQPRHYFDESSIKSLAETIRRIGGLIQPIVVRPLDSPDADYELIAGERRLRAVKSLGMDTISAIVRDDLEGIRSLALIENIQREDLPVLDKAVGFYQLREEQGSTEDTASILGIDRKTVDRYLKIAEAVSSMEYLADIIKTKKLNFTDSYELCMLYERLVKLKESEKDADKKRFSRIMSRLRDGNNKGEKFSEILEGVKIRLGKKAETKKPKPDKKNFWSTETEWGLNIRVPKIEASNPDVTGPVIQEIKGFLSALGINPGEVDIGNKI